MAALKNKASSEALNLPTHLLEGHPHALLAQVSFLRLPLPAPLLDFAGVANALDLTDRMLTRLQARPKCKPQLLNFLPYTKDEITSILQERLKQVSMQGLGGLSSFWRRSLLTPAASSAFEPVSIEIWNPVSWLLGLVTWRPKTLLQCWFPRGMAWLDL